jgi:hypothetical protein
VEAAVQLHEQHGLPAVSDLLRDLNEIRKKEAYGDVLAPSLNAEDVVAALERYVEVVNESLS